MNRFLSVCEKIIRSCLFAFCGKEFLIFLLFFVLSSVFWLLLTLNETYEKEFRIPIYVTSIPEKAILTSDVTDTFSVTVRDKGFVILSYMTRGFKYPADVNFGVYANKNTGKGVISTFEMQKIISSVLAGTSRITSMKPNSWEFYFMNGRGGRLPVRLSGKYSAARNYCISEVRFSPDTVRVYANKHILDSLSYATLELNIRNIKDTLVETLPFKDIKGVKFMPPGATVTICTDLLTEESVEVPVVPINIPEGKILRTFPLKARVKFSVGVSKFRTVTADQFKVVADYNDLMEHPSDKCTLYLRTFPPIVTNCRLEIDKVDYLIEQQ